MKISDGLRKYEKLEREEYFKKNQELAADLWQKEELPTVYDIAKYAKTGSSEAVDKIFEFFDNKEDFDKMINKDERLYKQDESSAFISKVMASNNKEISDSGYLYKLIMASADDYRIDDEDCYSEGDKVDLKEVEFDEDYFKFYIKDMYVEEFGCFVEGHFDEFEERYKEGLEKSDRVIHIRNPLTCKNHRHHGVCRKCAGILPEDLVNIGTFTCLCVTEFATQSALSSMNKGVKKNINQMVSAGYPGRDNWDDIKDWIRQNLEDLKTSPVESRYYQIVYLSRVRESKHPRTGELIPFVTSLKNSINHSGNLYGAFIFSPNEKKFAKMFEAGEFDDNSLKLKIAMNNFKEDTDTVTVTTEDKAVNEDTTVEEDNTVVVKTEVKDTVEAGDTTVEEVIVEKTEAVEEVNEDTEEDTEDTKE